MMDKNIVKFILFFVFFYPSFLFAQEIYINEVLIQGEYANDEYIELFNRSSDTINLSDWSIQYKSKSGKIYKKNFPKNTSILPSSFYLITHKNYTQNNLSDMIHSSFSLSNKGGTVYLVKKQKLIENKSDADIVDMIGWGDAYEYLQAPASTPPYGYTLNRKSFTGNNKEDFYISTPTPKSQNTEQLKGNPESIYNKYTSTFTSVESDFAQSGKIIISEIFPNPEGKDIQEWIEIKNIDTKTIDLSGWVIKDLKKEFQITSENSVNTLINPGGFYVFNKDTTNISLNNTSETIYLYDKNKNLISQIEYFQAPEGKSLIFSEDNYVWTSTPTPGKENIYTPNIQQKEKTTNYKKDKGNPPSPGNQNKTSNVNNKTNVEGKNDYTSVRITEIMPNPDDGNEWIEIYNNSKQDVSGEFKIEDVSGKSQKITLSLKPYEYTIITGKQLSISLNNNGDIISLLSPLDKVIQTISYPKAPKGQSYALINSIWNWSSPSPKQENTLILTKDKQKDIEVSVSVNPEDNKNTKYIQYTIENIKTNQPEYVLLTANILIPPREIAKSYFYVGDNTGSIQIKIKKRSLKIPDVKKYDKIFIKGKVFVENSEVKISPQSIEVVSKEDKDFTPLLYAIKISDIDLSDLGNLVSVAGEVTKSTKSYLYLDDGSEEIKIYLAKHIKNKNFKTGDNLKITGFLSKTISGLRLIPLSDDAINYEKPKKVLGAKTQEIINEKQQNYYFIIIFVIILISGIIIKQYLNARIHKRRN